MIYEFPRCRIDDGTREFHLDGTPVALEPQVFDLLLHFVRNPERVISRDELIEAVWAGRIVSDSAIAARINAARKAAGDSGKTQVVIKTVPRRGFRFVAKVIACGADRADAPAPTPPAPERSQKVMFCRSDDGTQIAYGQSGCGPPLIRVGHWLTHLEHDWQSPIWRPLLDELGTTYSLHRYDQRGNGLSDWEVEDFSLDAFVGDLEAVVDAAGLDRFAIFASSQAVPVCITYAVRHPERITRLVLHGGFALGRLLRSESERDQAEAYLTLMRHGWGMEGSQFLQSFSALYIPDGTQEEIASLAQQQRMTTSAENAVRLRRCFDCFDVTDILPQVTAPTLVTHARNDAIQPFSEGRKLAGSIRNAELVALESRNHVILKHEPAWPIFFRAFRRFVAP